MAVDKIGKIKRFIVKDSNLPTAKGISVGDSKGKILKAYGDHDYIHSQQGADIIGYVDKTNDISLEFWLFDDKVSFYRLDDREMT